MSALTRILTAPVRGVRRLYDLVQDKDHDTWTDSHHQERGTDTGKGKYRVAEKMGRYLGGGGTTGGGGS